MSFIIEGLTNPSLLSANVATTSWEVITATSLLYHVDGAYTNLKPSPDLEGIGVTVPAVEVASSIVFADTTMTVIFVPNSDLPSGAIIQIGLPDEFVSSPVTESCVQASPSSATLSCTYSTSGGYITSIAINNPCTHSNCKSTTVHAYKIAVKIRENTKDVGGSFSVTTKTSTEDIGIGSFTNSITILPNPFISTSLDNSGCNTVSASCSLIVKFTTVYDFPSKTNNGKIALTIPSDLTVVSTGCTATIAGSAME